MDIGTISIILLLGMMALLAIGMPLGFASGFLAVVVLVLKFGPDLLFSTFGTGPLNILAQRMYGVTINYVLVSVPLFILMATLLERSGIAHDMYSSLNMWLSRARGGIAIVTALIAIVMAAMSGIIGGEVVLLGLIALPQMLRLGYNQNLAVGTICASGSLGTMIPPSIVLIFYGLITETSIHALFRAAFVPGLMLAGCYIVYIIIRTQLHPEQAPLPEPSDDDISGRVKARCLVVLLGWLAAIAGGGALCHALAMEIQNGLDLLKPEDYQPYSTGQLAWFIAILGGGARWHRPGFRAAYHADNMAYQQRHDRPVAGGIRRVGIDLWRDHRDYRSGRNGNGRGIVADYLARGVFSVAGARGFDADVSFDGHHHLGHVWRHRLSRGLHDRGRADLYRESDHRDGITDDRDSASHDDHFSVHGRVHGLGRYRVC